MNSLDPAGKTALFRAAERGIDQAVGLLLQAGADVNRPSTRKGETPLMRAVNRGHESCVKLLLQAGADVNATCKQGCTALFTAVEKHNHCLVELLINEGADVNVVTACGTTALVEAAWNRYDKCIDLLLTAGADVNVTDFYGSTPLIKTSCFGIKYTGMFLRAGAKINVVNRYNRNAIRYHLAYCKPENFKQGLLLYAAGETIGDHSGNMGDGYAKVFHDYLLKEESELCLTQVCRKAIRERLIEVDPHVSLFVRIAKLGLPTLLVEFLLHNVSLNDDDDCT